MPITLPFIDSTQYFDYRNLEPKAFHHIQSIRFVFV